MLVRIALACARHPWRTLAVWLVGVMLAVGAGIVAGTVQIEDDSGSGDAAAAQRLIDTSDVPRDPPTEQVVVQRGSGLTARELAAVATGIGLDPSLHVVDTRLDATGRLGVVDVQVGGEQALAALATAAGRIASAVPGAHAAVTGGWTLDRASDRATDADLRRAELLSIPVTLGILLVVFGALLAAGLPVLLALSCVAAALGLAGLASHLVPVSDALSSVVLLVGMAVGVDYSLFLVRRQREERDLRRTLETAGHAVVVSGITVLGAMSGMFLAGNAVFTSLGMGTMLVVAVAVVGSVTVLPALVARSGRALDWPRRATPRLGHGRGWRVLMRAVERRPLVAALAAVVLLLALAAPALDMRTRLFAARDLPTSLPGVAAYDAMVAAFPERGPAHEVVVRADDVTRPAIRDRVAALHPSHVAIAPDRRTLVAEVPAVGVTVEALRRDVARGLGTVAEAHVGGDAAESADFAGLVRDRLPLVVGFVLLLTTAVMLAAFRSVRVALLTVALNLLSVAAAYGVLVLVFQRGPDDAIVAWLPLFLFVILFGLSMDYHVLVLSRIRECGSVSEGVAASAGAVTSAAAVMIAVFAIFATLTAPDLRQLGVGLGVAILLDATIVRALLLPAALHLLGWPRPRAARALDPALAGSEA